MLQRIEDRLSFRMDAAGLVRLGFLCQIKIFDVAHALRFIAERRCVISMPDNPAIFCDYDRSAVRAVTSRLNSDFVGFFKELLVHKISIKQKGIDLTLPL